MEYEYTARVGLPYSQAVDRVKEALAEQGFGVLSEIDVAATLKEKRDVDIEDYVILGACNPDLAHRALEVDRGIGVLLPCNVVVSADGDASMVRVVNPATMSTITGNDEMKPVADEADTRLRTALDRLSR